MKLLHYYIWEARAWLVNRPNVIAMWLAWKLPKRVVMWCFYRMFAQATSGEWDNVSPDDVTAWELLKRWAR